VKPLIGIIAPVDWHESKLILDTIYLKRIRDGGGIPIVFEHDMGSIEDVLSVIDGLLLVGGPDIHPKFYGEDPSNHLRAVNVERDFFEITLVRAAIERGIPILGLGRGSQVINVALGGTLYQDVATKIGRALKHDWDLSKIKPSQKVHDVRIKVDSKLYKILRESLDIMGTTEVFLGVNSFHHQAIKKIGEGLRPVAHTVDGIIEAIEGEEEFILGVQWRAEYLDEMQPLFNALVKKATEYREAKRELEVRELEAQIRGSEEASKEEQDENHHKLDESNNPPDKSQM